MATKHSALIGADLHNPKGISVETHSTSSLIISQSAGSHTGAVTASAMFVPSSTNTYDLGSAQKAWRKLYVITSSIEFVNPEGTTIQTLTADSSGVSFGSGQISGSAISGSGLMINGGGNITGDLILGGNITIGDSAADSIELSADISSSIIPDASDSYNLGNDSKRWNNLFLSGSISASGGPHIIESTTTNIFNSTTTTAITATTTLTAKGNAGATFGDDTGTWEFDGSGALSETGMTTISMTPSSTLTLQGGGVSKFGDDTAVWSFDGIGAVSETGMTTFSLTPSSTIDLDAGGALTLDGSSITIGGDSDVAVDFDASTFDLDASGALTIDSATSISIGAAADVAIDVDSSTFDLDASGALTMTSTTMAFDPSSTFDLDASGAITIDGTSTIGIGSVAAAGAINIGTNGTAREVTIGSNTGAGGITLVTGTGGIDVDAQGNIDIDAGTTSAISLDASAASNFTTSAGLLTLNGAAGVQLTGAVTSSTHITAGGNVTAVGSFIIGSADMNETDLEKLDGITDGTAAANKAVVLDASKNIATIGTVGCGAITSTGTSAFNDITVGGGYGSTGTTISSAGVLSTNGVATFASDVTIYGDLHVTGSTVTVDSSTLNVADKNITIGSGSTTSITMDGAGLDFGLDASVSNLRYRHSDAALTSSVDLSAPQLHSSIATGTAPLTVQSTTVVANLNATTVAGQTMADPGAIGTGTAAAITGTTIDATTDFTIGSTVITDDSIVMTPTSGDTATIAASTNGVLNITTVDTAAAAANITITADGTFEAIGTTVTLDSGGAINLEPADGSAILLDGTISVDAGVVTGATSITSTAFAGDVTGDVTGNTDTATALATGRTIAMTGDVAWTSPSFDGSGNVTAAGTIQANAVQTGMVHDDVATELAGAGTTATSGVLNVIGGNGITANADDVAVTPAQTTITSIYNTGLKIGYDASDNICFATGSDGQISYYQNGIEEFRMTAGGTFHADADVVAYSSTVASDMNLKENITDMKYGLDTVMQLRGVEYDWKREDMGHDLGVLAQEVEQVIPELVKEHEGLQGRGKFKSVDYNKLVPVLIESIKELKNEIDELKLNNN